MTFSRNRNLPALAGSGLIDKGPLVKLSYICFLSISLTHLFFEIIKSDDFSIIPLALYNYLISRHKSYLFSLGKPRPLGLRLVEPTPRRAGSE